MVLAIILHSFSNSYAVASSLCLTCIIYSLTLIFFLGHCPSQSGYYFRVKLTLVCAIYTCKIYANLFLLLLTGAPHPRVPGPWFAYLLMRKTPNKGPGKRELISCKKCRIARGRTSYNLFSKLLLNISRSVRTRQLGSRIYDHRHNRQKHNTTWKFWARR